MSRIQKDEVIQELSPGTKGLLTGDCSVAFNKSNPNTLIDTKKEDLQK